jgi:hypothetical protein
MRMQLCRNHGVVRIAADDLPEEDDTIRPGDRCSRCHDEMPVVTLEWETWRALMSVLRFWER